jgi:hypothetical protein
MKAQATHIQPLVTDFIAASPIRAKLNHRILHNSAASANLPDARTFLPGFLHLQELPFISVPSLSSSHLPKPPRPCAKASPAPAI